MGNLMDTASVMGLCRMSVTLINLSSTNTTFYFLGFDDIQRGGLFDIKVNLP